MTEVTFLTLAEAIEIHNDVVSKYGGRGGVRDYGLLQAALAVPLATFDGQFLHRSIFDMAAAYLYHVCNNHPFVDGNKRTALACALVFLDMNGIGVDDPEGVLFDLTMRAASGLLEKPAIASELRRLARDTAAELG
jgi:death-on-curing protein